MMRIDLSHVDDIEDLRSVPPGEYVCRIADARESRSPAGHVRWGLRWEVVHGEWAGRTACWDSLHWSERGLPRVKFVLQMLGYPVDGPLDLRPDQLLDRVAVVLVQPEEREDPATGVRRVANRVPYAGYGPAPPPGEERAASADAEVKPARGEEAAA